MSLVPVLDTLETKRLILRHRRVDEAAIYRQLWTERDPRVPPHRQIDPDGRPTVEDIAAQIRAEREEPGPGILAVERKDTADVIGYCGLIFHGNGPPDEPELAYELLRAAHGCGCATEAGRAVVTWASEAGYQRLWAGVRDWKCRIATGPGEARVPRNGPGGAGRCLRRQPANRTRVLNGAHGGSARRKRPLVAAMRYVETTAHPTHRPPKADTSNPMQARTVTASAAAQHVDGRDGTRRMIS